MAHQSELERFKAFATTLHPSLWTDFNRAIAAVQPAVVIAQGTEPNSDPAAPQAINKKPVPRSRSTAPRAHRQTPYKRPSSRSRSPGVQATTPAPSALPIKNQFSSLVPEAETPSLVATNDSYSPAIPDPEPESNDMDTAIHTDNEGFTLVQKNKPAKRASRSRPESPETQSRPQKAQRTGLDSHAPRSAAPSAPAGTFAGRKARRPPPVTVQNKSVWTKLSEKLRELRIHYTQASNTANGIRVQVSTSDEHRQFTRLLRDSNLEYFTYSLEEERQLRVVIRRIPVEITPEEVKTDLLAKAFPVREVHRMHGGQSKNRPLDMVLVILELTPEGRAIFNVRKVCELSGIAVEPPHKNRSPPQCHNCQLYGHSARNCHLRPRCVKCLGDHATSECSRTRESATPPSCVLCGNEGHPANYRGCPRAPRPTRPTRPMRPTRHTPPQRTRPAVGQPKPLLTPEAFPSLPGASSAPVAAAPAPRAPPPAMRAPQAAWVSTPRPQPPKAQAPPPVNTRRGVDYMVMLFREHDPQEVLAYEQCVAEYGPGESIRRFPLMTATLMRLARAGK